MLFTDRAEAGRLLAARLTRLHGVDVVVLGLPRGGVPVAFQVAKRLQAPLDVLVVRKLGVPLQPELAMGAVGEGGVRVVNDNIVAMAGVTPKAFAAVEQSERRELARRVERFRGDRPRVSLVGRTAVVVDDGIATGSTARAACQVARTQGAARIVLAAPVIPSDTVTEMRKYADQVVCLETPVSFLGIGQFYDDFTQTTDDEVLELLASTGDRPRRDDEVQVTAGTTRLPGRLTVPERARGLVVFAHGSGSSRHSPRNRFVADVLAQAGLGTLLFDLLTPDEENDRANVFDIELFAYRLAGATAWLRQQPGASDARIGYFGASTGAGAALWAAGDPAAEVAAIVSRGGRPDLAGPRLARVRAPTLLIVGGQDRLVGELNRKAVSKLRCESQLAIVPGATHLFEEPGTLHAAADLAVGWFLTHLTAAQPDVTDSSGHG